MHEAYKVNSIIKAQFHIDSITAFSKYSFFINLYQFVICFHPDNNVILGTKTGQLIEYLVDSEDTKQPQLVKFSKTFSKKQISQLEAVAEENLLFVLTDNVIVVCDISHSIFTTIHTAEKTKGASIFAVDAKVRYLLLYVLI